MLAPAWLSSFEGRGANRKTVGTIQYEALVREAPVKVRPMSFAPPDWAFWNRATSVEQEQPIQMPMIKQSSRYTVQQTAMPATNGLSP